MNAPAAVGELDRRTYIGGSRVAAILGLDPYGKTPLTEYMAIVGELENKPDPETLAFLEWRKEWEPVVLKRVIREFDAKIIATNQRYIDPHYPHFAAEIDFEWVDENGEIQNGEVKTIHPLAFSERSGWGDAGTSDVPVNYAAQCMWGLGVKQRQTSVLIAMAGIDTFVPYRIERDEETIAEMRQRCDYFWTENVLKRVPPDPISLEDCMHLALRMKGRPVEADDEMFEHLRSLNGIRESMKAMEGEKNEVMFNIAASILKSWGVTDPAATPTDNAVILRAGQQIASWNLQHTTRLQSKLLREEMPDIFAQFAKTTPSRVLRIKKVK